MGLYDNSGYNTNNSWLVVSKPPLWKMMEFVKASWDDDIPKIWKNHPNVQMTNQILFKRGSPHVRKKCPSYCRFHGVGYIVSHPSVSWEIPILAVFIPCFLVLVTSLVSNIWFSICFHFLDHPFNPGKFPLNFPKQRPQLRHQKLRHTSPCLATHLSGDRPEFRLAHGIFFSVPYFSAKFSCLFMLLPSGKHTKSYWKWS